MSSSVAAELAVTADHVDRYRERLAGLVLSLPPERHDDAVAAVHEAERALRSAHRHLLRAVALLER